MMHLKSYIIYFCYCSLMFSFNPKTKLRNGLIFYLKTNGITCLRKCVMQIIQNVLIFFENEANSIMRGNMERYLA